MFVYSPSMRLYPAIAAKFGRQAGWLTPIFIAPIFLCLIYIMQSLFKNNREANLSDIIFKVFGRILGSVLIFLYLLWALINLGIYVRYFAERFLAALLPDTPMILFIITILAATFYVLQKGIVYISRTAEFLFTIFTVIFVVLFLFIVKDIKVINLFPITYHDFLPLLKSTYSNLGLWGSFTPIFFLGDKINDKEHIRRFGLQSAIYLVITTIMISLQTIGVYGYSVIERVSTPYVFVIKSISILQTIERIESVAVISWIIVDFIAISFILYIIACIMKSFFSLSDEKPLLSPIVIFGYTFAQYIASDRFELVKFSETFSAPMSIFFGFVSPLIILIVGKIRKKV